MKQSGVRILRARLIGGLAVLLLLIVAASTSSVGAQVPSRSDQAGADVDAGASTDQAASPDDAPSAGAEPTSGGGPGTVQPGATATRGLTDGDTAGAPAAVTWWDLRGGYVAAGTGLRNRGFGAINLTGIPVGASIVRAYLTWSVLNPAELPTLRTGKFKGASITGTKAGQGPDPCWSATTGYTYRADVTSLVTGNGSYSLTGFASGQTDGADPFTAGSKLPMAEGASLFVVYAKTTYPQTLIRFYNGYQMIDTSTPTTLAVPFGFTVGNPAGEARTTFIGGDGQRNGTEPFSTVNNVSISAADWDGTDPPSPPYSQGNLWDTDTVQLRNIVKPGHTGARIDVRGGPDCLIWAGQAFSLGKFGGADTDGDRLLDGWEANGHDADNNGTIDVNLPAMGASVVRKDVFVEADHMGAEAVCPCHLPLATDLARIVSVYRDAPVGNPNGVRGINLHLDAGPARPGYNLGGGNLVPHDNDLNPLAAQFNALKAAHFNPLRAKTFYYMIFAHNYNGGTSSGNAFAIPNDSFVVTLGGWTGHGSSDAKVGTFVHEFGHNLGLQHGGNEGKNYKPNYLSVMNYFHQITGLQRVSGAPYFGYSNADLPDLVESALNEQVGLNDPAAAPFRARYFCPNDTQALTPGTANGPIDWTCGGAIQPPTVSVDINNDNVKNTLTGFNDWANLVFGGGAVGAGAEEGLEAKAPQVPAPIDLTFEEFQRLNP